MFKLIATLTAPALKATCTWRGKYESVCINTVFTARRYSQNSVCRPKMEVQSQGPAQQLQIALAGIVQRRTNPACWIVAMAVQTRTNVVSLGRITNRGYRSGVHLSCRKASRDYCKHRSGIG